MEKRQVSFIDYLAKKAIDADYHSKLKDYGDTSPRETMTVQDMEEYYEKWGDLL